MPPQFLFTIFPPFLCLRGKNSLRLLELSTRKCQFPHIYRTVASPYNITAASLTLCTVTASFSALCAFLVCCIAFTRPLPSKILLQIVSPHFLFPSSRYFVASSFCVILCVSVPPNMPPCGWGEILCCWSGLPCGCAYVHYARGNLLFNWSDPLCGWSTPPSGGGYLFGAVVWVMAIPFSACLSHFNGI